MAAANDAVEDADAYELEVLPPLKRARSDDDAPGGALVARREHLGELLASFGALRRAGQLCDVVVVVDGADGGGAPARFDAHRVVLAAGSGYFRALFTSGLRESAQAVVDVGELDASAARDVIEFLYSGRLDARASTLAATLRAAARLDVRPLLELGAAFLADGLAPETTLASWAVASAMGDRPELAPLRAACERAAARDFGELRGAPAFGELDAERLAALLARDDLSAKVGERERARARSALSTPSLGARSRFLSRRFASCPARRRRTSSTRCSAGSRRRATRRSTTRRGSACSSSCATR